MVKIIHGFFDGACMDPIKDGPLGFGYHANYFGEKEGSLFRASEAEGIGTNNQAEIISLYRLMKRLSRFYKGSKVFIRGDSNVIIQMVKGEIGVSNSFLKKYIEEIKSMESNFEAVGYEQIPRTQNRLADSLSKKKLPQKEINYYKPRF